MKKLEKLYEGRSLSASIGKLHSYNYKQMTVSASQHGDAWMFTTIVQSHSGHDKDITGDLRGVLEAMKAFAPKAASWKVSKKPKAVKVAKAKVSAQSAEQVASVAIRKGRG